MPVTKHSAVFPVASSRYLCLRSSDIALFRFLLESYGHVGTFRVLDKYKGLIKIDSTADLCARLDTVLAEMSHSVAFCHVPVPWRVCRGQADYLE